MHASDRAVALSGQLIRAHQTLRERLASVREEVAGGITRPAIAGGLLSHCLGFCTAVQGHHAGEDSQLFPALRAAAPELSPLIDKLMEDHALVAGILRQVRALLAPDRPPPAPGALLRELDGLTAILESHFSFEERRIATALDSLGPEAWTADVFAP